MFYFVLCSLSGVIERWRILAEAQGCVLLARKRIELMKQAYDSSKSLLQEGIYIYMRINLNHGDFYFYKITVFFTSVSWY